MAFPQYFGTWRKRRRFAATLLIFLLFGLGFPYLFLLAFFNNNCSAVQPSSTPSSSSSSSSPSIVHNCTDNFNTNSAEESDESSSYLALMKSIPWPEFEQAVIKNDTGKIRTLSTLLLHKLTPFLLKSPPVPVNTSCTAPALSFPPKIKSIYLSARCIKLPTPRKIGVLLQFGYDADALEIHFHELDAVVDKFFILESIQTHSEHVKGKPLLWDSLKFTERFRPFVEKVVHFVMDDSNFADGGNGNQSKYHTREKGIWRKESMQEKLRWIKFLEWNEATQFFQDSDFLGFGDSDEIPHRDNIYYLKHCEVFHEPVDIGIWFPFRSTQTLFSHSWSVPGHPYTLGDPTYWSLASAKAARSYPTRKRGAGITSLFGGMHFSTYPYPPLRFTKHLAATESFASNIQQVLQAGKYYMEGDIPKAENALNIIPDDLQRYIKDMEEFRKEEKAEAERIVKQPWFYSCNLGRYPSFQGGHDRRLDS